MKSYGWFLKGNIWHLVDFYSSNKLQDHLATIWQPLVLRDAVKSIAKALDTQA